MHPTKPTSEELERFLLEHGSDVDEGKCYEHVEQVKEIIEGEYKTIPKKNNL